MTHAERLAASVVRVAYDDLSEAARQQSWTDSVAPSARWPENPESLWGRVLT